MKNNVELMNLFWTTSGVLPGVTEISRFDFKDRVEAAARAGFKSIGIWHTDLEYVLSQRSLPEMKMILDDNGMKYLELEFLNDWFLDPVRCSRSRVPVWSESRRPGAFVKEHGLASCC